MNNKTACPLDCYDACAITFDEGKIKGEKDTHTKGYLCSHMNHYETYPIIQKPRFQGKDISMQEALEILYGMLEQKNILHYRGSGNFGLMQEVMDHFFASYGATLTEGSLCDGAGRAGIVEGRGSNKNISLEELEKTDVVILWGRNPHTTSSHLLPYIQDKTIIVIDPVKTKIAKNAHLHIQIKPHGDLELALLLARFLYIHESIDEEYLEEYGSEYEDFYELTQTLRIKAKLEAIDVTLGEVGTLLKLIEKKKVTIICGVGVQKYSNGADVLRAIDGFALFLGLFGKEGCGVMYLGDSQAGIDTPFYTKAPRVSRVNTPFETFETVFIQGANPLAQMPNTSRVQKSLQQVKNIIYFGLYENETSQIADLVIPAKPFLYKNDIRVSYGHHHMLKMPQVAKCDSGISEYDLSALLCQKFGIEIQDEAYYINHFQSFATQKDDTFYVKEREAIPYQDGFDTDDGEFLFLDDYDSDKQKGEGAFFLITPKSKKSLNSQFQRETNVYVHSSLGYKEGEIVRVSSENGFVDLPIKYNDDIRKDCVLIYSGTKGVNYLTSSKHSLDGKSAIYQEYKVNIEKI